MAADPWILTIDIGGTKVALAAGRPDGTIGRRREHATDPDDFGTAMTRLLAAAAALIAEVGRPPASVGVSAPGPVDHVRGVITGAPNLPGWHGEPLAARLAVGIGVPVVVEHDAKAAALAEWRFGAARGARTVVFLTMGTGLGSGLIIDGRLHRGAHDAAGEVGHWRMAMRGPHRYGKTGSWEALSCGGALPGLLRARDRDRSWPDDLGGEQVVALARAGDADARAAVRTAATYLGRGCALLIDLLDPDIIVLGSLAVRAGDLILPVARRVVARECLSSGRATPIVPAGLGAEAGDAGALAAALHHLGGPAA